jgi:FkbM family methyltransferase
MLRELVKRGFAAFDIQVKRCSRDPRTTLLGLGRRKMRTVLDVGANEGQFARYLARFFPGATFYCFEPLPSVFPQLQAWGASEKTVTVVPLNYAVGDQPGTLPIRFHVEHPSSSSFLPATKLHQEISPASNREETVPVPLLTLDGAVAKGLVKLEPDVLIKLDVQGFEDRVIRGGRETFRRATACIVEVCLETLFEGQPRFVDIVEILTELGFEFAGNLEQFPARDGHVMVIDAVFVQRSPSNGSQMDGASHCFH